MDTRTHRIILVLLVVVAACTIPWFCASARSLESAKRHDLELGVGVFAERRASNGSEFWVPYVSVRDHTVGVLRRQPHVDSPRELAESRDVLRHYGVDLALPYIPNLFPLAALAGGGEPGSAHLWLARAPRTTSDSDREGSAIAAIWGPDRGFQGSAPTEFSLPEGQFVHWCIAVQRAAPPLVGTHDKALSQGWLLLGGARHDAASPGGRNGWVRVLRLSGVRLSEEPDEHGVLSALGLDREAFFRGEVYVTSTQTEVGVAHTMMRVTANTCQMWEVRGGVVAPVYVTPYLEDAVRSATSGVTALFPYVHGQALVLRVDPVYADREGDRDESDVSFFASDRCVGRLRISGIGASVAAAVNPAGEFAAVLALSRDISGLATVLTPDGMRRVSFARGFDFDWMQDSWGEELSMAPAGAEDGFQLLSVQTGSTSGRAAVWHQVLAHNGDSIRTIGVVDGAGTYSHPQW